MSLGQEESDARAIDDRLAQAAGFIDAELKKERTSLAAEEAAAAAGEAARKTASQGALTQLMGTISHGQKSVSLQILPSRDIA